MNAVRDLVRMSGYCPALRRDVQFSTRSYGVVETFDPRSNRRWDLSDLEYKIASEMNGKRDLAELREMIAPSMPPQVRNLELLIEQTVVKLSDMNVLEAPIPMAPIIPLRPQGKPQKIELDGPTMLTNLDDFAAGLDGATDIVDADKLFEDDDVIASTNRERFARPPSQNDEGTIRAFGVPPPTHNSAPWPLAHQVSGAYSQQVTGPIPYQAPPQITGPIPLQDLPPPPAAPPSAPTPSFVVEQPRWYKQKRTRRLLIAGGILGAIILIGIIPYPLYITEECVVVPIDRSDVRTQINGLVAEVLVREGDKVEIGTPLVRLDDKELSYNLAQAQSEVDRYTANLAKVKGGNRVEEVHRSQAQVNAKAQDVKFAEITANRQQKLFADGVASAAARDDARRDLEVKRAAYSEAQAELRLVQAGSRSEEVTIAEAELHKTEAEVSYLKKQMDGLLVRSPINGRVLTPNFEERLHTKLAAGDFVCEIGNAATVKVNIYVPENEADVIEVGQPVSVKVKSYPLQSFKGRVSHIGTAIEEIDKNRVMRVETELDNEANLLRPRMSGFGEIDAGSRPIGSRIFRRALRWLRVRFLL